MSEPVDLNTLATKQLIALVQVRGEAIHKLAEAISVVGSRAAESDDLKADIEHFLTYAQMLGLHMAKTEEMICAGQAGGSVDN